MYAVMGITGHVGGALANALLTQGYKVRGITRDASKAQHWRDKGADLMEADYDDRLIEALSGTEGVFAMIPPNLLPEPGYPDSVERVAALRKAILAAKPPKAVFLSSWGSEQPSRLGLITPNRILEQNLIDTGIPSAFLRPAWFIENLIYSIATARSTGQYFSFYQPLNRAYAMVATEDVGRNAADILLQHWSGNRFVEIAGPQEYSSDQVAAALAKALDQKIVPVAVPRESWVDVLAQNGMPPDRSGAYIEMVDSLNDNWIHFQVPGTEHIRGNQDLLNTVRALVAQAA